MGICHLIFVVTAAILLVLVAVGPETARAQTCTDLTAGDTAQEVNFDGGTLDNVCWRISAPAGRYAVVNIHSISVERNFDYLTARRSRGPTTAYVKAPVVLSDDDFIYVTFKSDDNTPSEGFSFSYYSVSAPGGSCGDGVVSSIEACDPALSPTCRFDCTTTSAANVVRAGSGTYACDLVYATNNETASITHEPTKNEAKCWLFIPDTDVADAAMRVEVSIGDLQACCDHVWVNGVRYLPNNALVFGGKDPVEVRFRSVAANVTGDITMEYRSVPIGEVGECGDRTVGPTESCDDGNAGGCSEVCQGYATAPECELDSCLFSRSHCEGYDLEDEYPTHIGVTAGSLPETNCHDLADATNDTSYLRLRVSTTKFGDDEYAMVVVDGQVVDILHGYNDQVYAFPDSDDVLIVLRSGEFPHTYFGGLVDVCSYDNGRCDEASGPFPWVWLMLSILGVLFCAFMIFLISLSVMERKERAAGRARARAKANKPPKRRSSSKSASSTTGDDDSATSAHSSSSASDDDDAADDDDASDDEDD